MSAFPEFDSKSQTIPFDGQVRRSEARAGRDIIDPAAAGAIDRLAETSGAEEASTDAD